MYSDVAPYPFLADVGIDTLFPSFSSDPSSKEAGTARLNGLNLGLGPCQPLEASGKLSAVEVKSLAGLDRSEGCTWGASDVSSARVGARLV